MKHKIFETINKYEMLKKDDAIVIGFSGGADSVCLTHFLFSVKDELNLELVLAHINHGIRGDEAKRDENFCREFADKLNLPINILSADVPSECEKTGEGEEECGRRIRYEFFESLAGDKAKIATAHNLNDNAETVMLNILRGTGNKGLCGIPPVRGNIIRPLISVSRYEIENYCKENSLNFVVDSTNLKNNYKRNKIRNVVFSEFSEINPSFLTAFSRLIENSSDDEDLLESLSESEYNGCKIKNGLDESALLLMPSAIRRRVLYKAISDFSEKNISSVHISQVESIIGTGKTVITSGGITVKSRGGALSFISEPKVYCDFLLPFDIANEKIEYPYGVVKIQILNQKDLQNFNKQVLDNAVDCDKIVDNLVLRSRREGDSFRSARRHNTKSVKKMFNEAKILPEKRNTVPVLCCGSDIIWIDTFGVSEHFKANINSGKIIIIENISGVNYYEG